MQWTTLQLAIDSSLYCLRVCVAFAKEKQQWRLVTAVTALSAAVVVTLG